MNLYLTFRLRFRNYALVRLHIGGSSYIWRNQKALRVIAFAQDAVDLLHVRQMHVTGGMNHNGDAG